MAEHHDRGHRESTEEPQNGGGFFDRPLWRIIVPILLVSFAVQRFAVGTILYAEGETAFGVIGTLFQALVALGVAVWIFRGKPRLQLPSNERPGER